MEVHQIMAHCSLLSVHFILLSIAKAHIIVSELLGSFGGNELSPECLDGGLEMLREGTFDHDSPLFF